MWDIVTDELKKAIADRLEGWELVDFLQISAEDVIEAFEDRVIENLEDVKDFADLRGFDENSNDSD